MTTILSNEQQKIILQHGQLEKQYFDKLDFLNGNLHNHYNLLLLVPNCDSILQLGKIDVDLLTLAMLANNNLKLKLNTKHNIGKMFDINFHNQIDNKLKKPFDLVIINDKNANEKSISVYIHDAIRNGHKYIMCKTKHKEEWVFYTRTTQIIIPKLNIFPGSDFYIGIINQTMLFTLADAFRDRCRYHNKKTGRKHHLVNGRYSAVTNYLPWR